MFSSIVSRSNLVNRITNLVTTPIPQNGHLLPSLVPARFIASLNNVSKKPQNLTLDYLTDTCGLSPESALKVSKHIRLKSTTKPDLVLALFNSYGFTQPQISKIIKCKPRLLLAKLDKTLKPKLEYFSNMGISGPILGKIISTDPNILSSSLENKIAPTVNFLRSLVHSDSSIATILSKYRGMLNDAERFVGTNVAILRDHLVPQSNISNFLVMNPRALRRNTDVFNKTVLQLVSMGFCVSSMMFIHGLIVLGMAKPKWDEKMAVFNSFGWSEDEVLSLFKKYPVSMSVSVKKISLALDFFMNCFKWTAEDIAKNPSVITFSLEKRIIPRCHVLQILLSKNLITNTCVGSALRVGEDVFLMKYVSKFHSEVPDLLNMYQSKR